ncbi:MAG TPA: ABC transporter permease [Thermomicrobiales bacterium]|nr:ABC transporter permease [Thermomicrobiales bacterium]
MRLSTVAALGQREMADALRNRWFIAYAGAFVVLSVALALLVINSAGYGGISGFGRTSAGLVNLVLFLAPLMGLTLGAQALANEREQGTLGYLMAQPVSFLEVFLAKFLGLAVAIASAIVSGFALSTLTINALSGGEGMDTFFGLTGLTVLLALAALSIGYLISSVSRRTSTALGIAIVVWLALVLIGDLGLMGTAVIMKLSPGELMGLTLLNPLELYRIASIFLLRDSLELLGPSGLVAHDWFGGSISLVLGALLMAWIAVPLAVAYRTMARQEQR